MCFSFLLNFKLLLICLHADWILRSEPRSTEENLFLPDSCILWQEILYYFLHFAEGKTKAWEASDWPNGRTKPDSHTQASVPLCLTSFHIYVCFLQRTILHFMQISRSLRPGVWFRKISEKDKWEILSNSSTATELPAESRAAQWTFKAAAKRWEN